MICLTLTLKINILEKLVGNMDKSLLNISEIGNDNTRFFSDVNTPLAIGYNRVVFCQHGPYVEFEMKHVVKNSFYIFDDSTYIMLIFVVMILHS